MFNFGNFYASTSGCRITFSSADGSTFTSSTFPSNSGERTNNATGGIGEYLDRAYIPGMIYSATHATLDRSQVGGNIQAGEYVKMDRSHVGGNIQAGEYVQMDRSQVAGSVKTQSTIQIDNSTITGSIFAHSDASISRSTVDGVLTTGGSFTKIDKNSKINKIIIEPHLQELVFGIRPVKQTIEINHGSTVGNILFESGNGEVLVKNGSKVTGKVIGGRTQYLNDECREFNTSYNFFSTLGGSFFFTTGESYTFSSTPDGSFTFTEGRSHKPQESHQSGDKRHALQSFAEKIGYKLTGNPAKDYRNMARKVHPDMKGGSNELMIELNMLYNK